MRTQVNRGELSSELTQTAFFKDKGNGLKNVGSNKKKDVLLSIRPFMILFITAYSARVLALFLKSFISSLNILSASCSEFSSEYFLAEAA